MRISRKTRWFTVIVFSALCLSGTGCIEYVRALFEAGLLGTLLNIRFPQGGDQPAGSSLPPAVVNVSVTTTVNTPVSASVISAGSAVDAVLATLTATVTSGPANGTVAIDPATKSIRYTPATNFTGLDEFTVQVCNNANPPQCGQGTVTVTVTQAPTFTSANATTFVVGTSSNFNLTAGGFPTTMTFTNSGAALPGGATLAANGTLSGTPNAGTGGVYNLQFTASNGVAPNATQAFTLTINQAPAFTSNGSVNVNTGVGGVFQLTASGTPAPTFTNTGVALPGGVTLSSTGTLTVAPQTVPGIYVLQFTAGNGVLPNAVQTFTLTVFGL